MNKKTKEYIGKAKKGFERKYTLPLGIILILCVTSMILFGIATYFIGRSDANYDMELELKSLEKAQAEDNLMQLTTSEVGDIFFKYLMIKVMSWLPIIMLFLGAGWILHGI